MISFIQTAVAHFRESILTFNYPGFEFHFGPHALLIPASGAHFISQLSVDADQVTHRARIAESLLGFGKGVLAHKIQIVLGTESTINEHLN